MSQSRSTPKRWLASSLVALALAATTVQAACVSLTNSKVCPGYGGFSISTAVKVSGYGITMGAFTDLNSFDAAVNAANGFYTSPSTCTGYNATTRIRYQNSVLCALFIADPASSVCITDLAPNPLCATGCSQYATALEQMVTKTCPKDTTSLDNVASVKAACTPGSGWAGLSASLSPAPGCTTANQIEPTTCGFATPSDSCGYCSTNASDACCSDATLKTTCAALLASSSAASPSATASTTLSVPGTSQTVPPTTDDNSSNKSGLSTPVLAGIIGGSVGVIVLSAVLFMCIRRSRKQGPAPKGNKLNRQMSNSSARYNISSPKVQEEGFSNIAAVPIAMTAIPSASHQSRNAPEPLPLAGAAALGAHASVASNAQKPSFCQAIYPYQASMADELELTPGDIVNVHKVFDDGWAVGTNLNTSCEGAFPVVCVAAVDESALDDDFEDVNMHSMQPMTHREDDGGRQSPSGRNSPRSSLPSRPSSPVHLPRRNSSIRDSAVLPLGSSPLASSPLAGGNEKGGRLSPAPQRDTMMSDASSINRWWDGEGHK